MNTEAPWQPSDVADAASVGIGGTPMAPFWSHLVHREDDPSRFDWGAIVTLVLLGSLFAAVIGFFVWIAISFSTHGIPGPG